MKTSVLSRFALLTAFLLPLALPAAESWNIDEGHSTARFKIRHMMVSNVSGEIGVEKGKFTIDDDASKMQVEATLDAKTITTHNAKRDEHLKSGDFFDVKKFPKITFKSKKVEAEGTRLKITGDLTMHGVTKEVQLESAEGLTPPVKDPWGNTRRGFSATAKINRKDFGLTWNKTLDGGGVVVGEEVEVNVECEVMAPKKGDKKG